VAEWVKDLTSVAWVAAKVQVQSSAWLSELKDLLLPRLHCRSQMHLRFHPWPKNFYMPWVWPLKKKKKEFCELDVKPCETLNLGVFTP